MGITFTNFQGFATTEYRCQAVLLRDVDLLCQQLAIFSKILTTLAVTQDHMLDPIDASMAADTSPV